MSSPMLGSVVIMVQEHMIEEVVKFPAQTPVIHSCDFRKKKKKKKLLQLTAYTALQLEVISVQRRDKCIYLP